MPEPITTAALVWQLVGGLSLLAEMFEDGQQLMTPEQESDLVAIQKGSRDDALGAIERIRQRKQAAAGGTDPPPQRHDPGGHAPPPPGE